MSFTTALVRSTLILGLLLGTASLSQAQVLWYNGDLDGRDGLSNKTNTQVPNSNIYDDFIIPVGQTWNVTGVFSNDAVRGATVTSATYQIRQGVSSGNGGTLLFSGAGTPTVTATGRTINGDSEFTVSLATSGIVLTSGTYFLNVTPVGNGRGKFFLSTTSGANAVGTPPGNNGNSFLNSAYYGANFTPASNFVGSPADFSEGVLGKVVAPVPEPGSIALLTGLSLTGAAFLRRRKIASKAV